MKPRRARLRSASCALALLCLPGQGVEVPRNDGWVTDLADMLGAEEERSLEALMESYRVGSEHEIALLTVPDLGGRSIEEFALAVGRTWGLGREGIHDGALLLVARDERELRIEVGRGLEGALVDSLCGRIIRDVIVPEFRQGKPYLGIRKGIEAMHAVVGGDYGPLDQASGKEERSGLGWLVLIVLLLLLTSFRRSGRGGRYRSGGGSVLPWILASQLGNLSRGSRGGFGGGRSGGGFGGFGGGGGFSGGGASGRW